MAFIDDLLRVLGVTKIFDANSNTSRIIDLSLGTRGLTSFASNAGNEVQNLLQVPGRVYGMTFYCSSVGGDARWNLLDATASGVGGTAKFTYIPVAVGAFHVEFNRPLVFNSGIQINYTATAGLFHRQVSYGAN